MIAATALDQSAISHSSIGEPRTVAAALAGRRLEHHGAPAETQFRFHQRWGAIQLPGKLSAAALYTCDHARVQSSHLGNMDRLVALENRYDPANVIRLNQNIKPMEPRAAR